MDFEIDKQWIRDFCRKFSNSIRKYQYARKRAPFNRVIQNKEIAWIKAELKEIIAGHRRKRCTLDELKEKYPDRKSLWNVKYLCRLLSGSGYKNTPWFSDCLDSVFTQWFR